MTGLRVGLVGLGMMGRNHARVLSELDGVELVAVCDPQAEHGLVPTVQEFDHLLELDLDACVVASPTAFHVEHGMRLARAGVHALIEKPLGRDVQSAVALVEAFESAGLVGCVGHIERFNPALRSLRQRLEAGELGSVIQVSTRRQGPFPFRIRDAGVVLDLATHDLDLTCWVADSSYRQVAAQIAHKTDHGHEDLVAATGLLVDGTVTNHLVNWLTPMKERMTWVTGERGCFAADTLTADLTFYANADVPTEWDAISRFRGVAEGNATRYAIPKPEPLVEELAAFRDAVLGIRQEAVSMRQGLAAVAMAEALLTSATKGVTLDVSADVNVQCW